MALIPRGLLLVALLLSARGAWAQDIVEHYEPVSGFLRIGPEPDRMIPMVDKGLTAVIPEGEIRGVAVFFQRQRFDVRPYVKTPGDFEYEAAARGVATVHITSGDPLDFFFDEANRVDAIVRLQILLEARKLRRVPVLFLGMSLGGTRALKLATYLEAEGGRFWLRPSAAAVVDAPLDMIRFHEAETRAARDSVHWAAADEGRWVTYLMENALGGGPVEFRDAYVDYSPFTYSAPGGGNARYLGALPLRAYHEPDVDWWIAERGKSYYQMNSIDLAALVAALHLAGNDRAELVTTHRARKGYEDGASPHTWSIVDNAELLDWFLEVTRPAER